ncbi:MAG: hypothetical protein M3552_18675, partial [Planctomycetota bacterium]|nr:hypothetical protein [Planctomycetota bacterium]
LPVPTSAAPAIDAHHLQARRVPEWRQCGRNRSRGEELNEGRQVFYNAPPANGDRDVSRC